MDDQVNILRRNQEHETEDQYHSTNRSGIQQISGFFSFFLNQQPFSLEVISENSFESNIWILSRNFDRFLGSNMF
jgi:hypothetical protein